MDLFKQAYNLGWHTAGAEKPLVNPWANYITEDDARKCFLFIMGYKHYHEYNDLLTKDLR